MESRIEWWMRPVRGSFMIGEANGRRLDEENARFEVGPWL